MTSPRQVRIDLSPVLGLVDRDFHSEQGRLDILGLRMGLTRSGPPPYVFHLSCPSLCCDRVVRRDQKLDPCCRDSIEAMARRCNGATDLMFTGRNDVAKRKAVQIAGLWAELHGIGVLELDIFSDLLRDALVLLSAPRSEAGDTRRDGDMR